MPELDTRQAVKLASHVVGLIHEGDVAAARDLLEIAARRHDAASARGRLPRELKIDETQLEILAGSGASFAEIAALAGVSESSLRRRVADSDSLARAYARGGAGLRLALKRRLVFEALVGGEPRALSLLLSNLCGWRSSGEAAQGLEMPGETAPEVEAEEARRESVALELRDGLEIWRETFGKRKIEAGQTSEVEIA